MVRKIISQFLSMFSEDIGIDLGTANTLVAIRGIGIVVFEPSIVAIRKDNRQILLDGEAVGDRAKEMEDRAPANISIIRPMKDGVIADFDVTQAMLRYFIRKAREKSSRSSKWLSVKPRVLIAVPTGITMVERRAVIDAAERAGAREVFLIEEPMAAAIGAGLPTGRPTGSMIVDIGGGTTEVAVVSLGDMAARNSIRVAGDEMDSAIILHIRKAHKLAIGNPTAEHVKLEIGSAEGFGEEKKTEIAGINLATGLPERAIVTSEEIRVALRPIVDSIIKVIKQTLEETRPELAGDVLRNGIVLAGGGSLLRGLGAVITRETGIPVRSAEDPMTCVARGTFKVLEKLELYEQVLFTSDDLIG
ncbi:MAG: rod shape-determining protein [Candidatus Brocadiia bacterium]